MLHLKSSIYNSLKKYLEINLTKGVKDLYNENYKSLKKEIGEDIRRCEALPCTWINRISTLKMVILQQSVSSMQAASKINPTVDKKSILTVRTAK
jgi:hypothetical protein